MSIPKNEAIYDATMNEFVHGVTTFSMGLFQNALHLIEEVAGEWYGEKTIDIVMHQEVLWKAARENLVDYDADKQPYIDGHPVIVHGNGARTTTGNYETLFIARKGRWVFTCRLITCEHPPADRAVAARESVHAEGPYR